MADGASACGTETSSTTGILRRVVTGMLCFCVNRRIPFGRLAIVLPQHAMNARFPRIIIRPQSVNNSLVVEQGIPLSQSFIWNLQARFYESLGIDAWLSGVIPSKITTNAFMAKTYARMIAAYALDVQATELTIVELGAGHGRFGFLCVQHLVEMQEAGLFPVTNWKYVMTDVAERNIGYWQRHEALRPLVKRGVLDFARYEAGVDTAIQLRESGAIIGTANPVQNLVVIGNYFFDSLPIDVWQADGEELYECRPVFSLTPDATCQDKSDVAILDQLEIDWQRERVPAAAYRNPEWNALIEHFRARLGSGVFTLPVGAFQTLDALDRWSRNGHLLLTADKGYAREDDLVGRPLPTMVKHGCFSFSLNFCALAKWFAQQGGRTWLPKYRDGDLEFAAFSRNPGKPALTALDYAYREGPAEFSPADFHRVVRRSAETNPDMRNCLSLIRLSSYEPQVLFHLRRAIRSQLDSASTVERTALREILERVAGRYFHLDEQDVPFAIGLIYQRLGDFAKALTYYRRSLELFGDDATNFYNMAVCFDKLNDRNQACEFAQRAVELDRDNEEAVELARGLGVEPSALATAAN